MSHHDKKHPHQPHAAESAAEAPAPEQTTPAAAQNQAVSELDKIKAERDDYLVRLQRLSADYQNYQKRAAREINEIRASAAGDVLKSFLPILDDMERALEAAKANTAQNDPLLVGMNLVHGKALEMLQRYGLTPLEAQGKAFDPNSMLAVMHMPDAQHEPGTVIKELQRGYGYNGRVLRPATVVVAKEPEAG